jgi:transcriptional regulator with XRE-family HTH domain
MNGSQLKLRIKALGLPQRIVAAALGLSVPGLQHQLRGEAQVSRRTELLLSHLEQRQEGERGVEKRTPVPPVEAGHRRARRG